MPILKSIEEWIYPEPERGALDLGDETRLDIQGFITNGFDHLCNTAYVLVQFDNSKRASIKLWLESIRALITPAALWDRRKDSPEKLPFNAMNIAFSLRGLSVLGLPEKCIETFPSEFLKGMACQETARNLGDTGKNDPHLWKIGGLGGDPIHALLIISAKDAEALDAELNGLTTAMAKFAGVKMVGVEVGKRPSSGKEPFGFRDGISNPVVRGIQKQEGVMAGEFILGYENETGFVTVSPILSAAEDPRQLLPDSANPMNAGFRDFGLNGSFLVFRKLEQDVAGFWRFMQSESHRRLGRSDPEFMIQLAAKIVGRKPDGTPLTPHRDDNDFNYSKDDPKGLHCPFGAHIRRTNPRDQISPAAALQSEHMTARHRILRRGKPYGDAGFDPLVLLNARDEAEIERKLATLDGQQPCGIYFICLNASIKSQFEFIQQVWANNPHFNGLVDNSDPIIGDNGEAGSKCSMLVPKIPLDQRTAVLPRFVTVRGGGYFFMPGLQALSWLAA